MIRPSRKLWSPRKRLWAPRDRRGMLAFSLAESGCECCEEECCEACLNCIYPDQLEVAISGFDGIGIGNPACTDCNNSNATWIVDRQPPCAPALLDGTPVDRETWILTSETTYCGHPLIVLVQIWASRRIQVQIGNFTTSTTTYVLPSESGGPHDCMNFDELSIPYFAGGNCNDDESICLLSTV